MKTICYLSIIVAAHLSTYLFAGGGWDEFIVS